MRKRIAVLKTKKNNNECLDITKPVIPIHHRYIATNNLHHQGTDEQRVLALYLLFQHSCLTATIYIAS